MNALPILPSPLAFEFYRALVVCRLGPWGSVVDYEDID